MNIGNGNLFFIANDQDPSAMYQTRVKLGDLNPRRPNETNVLYYVRIRLDEVGTYVLGPQDALRKVRLTPAEAEVLLMSSQAHASGTSKAAKARRGVLDWSSGQRTWPA